MDQKLLTDFNNADFKLTVFRIFILNNFFLIKSNMLVFWPLIWSAFKITQ